MICPACGAAVRGEAAHCPTCGARLDPAASAEGRAAATQALPATAAPVRGPQAAPTAGLPSSLAAGGKFAPSGSVGSGAAKARRRWKLPFFGGLCLGLLIGPGLIALALMIFGGVNAARKQAAPPPNQPDVSVLISRSYLERALEKNPKLRNPRLQIGQHPAGGAALTITVGVEFPLVGFQDVHGITQLIAADGKLVVVVEQAGLGENGGIGIPGTIVEREISEMINNEIDKRVRANPNLVIDIVQVAGADDAIRVDAALRQAGQ